ncbi:MAG: DUF3035 domain-containing protein [Kiloniellales bacterium]
MRRPIVRRAGLLCLTLATLALAGCEGAREQLGLDKQAPDEFRVVSRAPLTVPPEFALRPPRPGAARPQVGTPTDQARRSVFRLGDQQASVQEVMPDDGRSLGERAILLQAGANQVAPDIRQVVDRETQRVNEESEDFLEDLIFWRDALPSGDIIDAEAEARRLREARAIGEPVTGAGTPTIDRRERGILEGIF